MQPELLGLCYTLLLWLLYFCGREGIENHPAVSTQAGLYRNPFHRTTFKTFGKDCGVGARSQVEIAHNYVARCNVTRLDTLTIAAPDTLNPEPNLKRQRWQ